MPKKMWDGLMWDELSGFQRGAIVLSGGGPARVARCGSREHLPAGGEMRGGKRLWVAAAFINFAGRIAYSQFGRER
jgi:hypothetical protein